MPTKPPNIVMLVADDQRFDTISALGLGCPGIRTPNFDALVRDGVAFTHAHLPGGTHGAVCMPSRAMFLTGRGPFHIQAQGQNIRREHVTLPEHFGNNRWDTHIIGKWHNGRESLARSFKGGDEIMFGGMADHWNVPCYHFDPTGKYASRLPMIKDPQHNRDVILREADHITPGMHSTDLFAAAAVKFIRGRKNSDRPFFLYTAFLAPHDPRSTREPFASMYPPESIELPKNFQPEHTIDTGDLRGRDESLANFPRDPAEIRRHLADYYGMVSHLDEAVGLIRAALEEVGEWQNTILIHMADHGIALGQHGLLGKQNVYDHSIRVPLIMTGPGLPRNQRRDGWLYLQDIFPTLCELTGVERPTSVEGRSLSSMLQKDSNTRDKLYLLYCWGVRGIKIGRHKLIEYSAHGTRGTQIFDLVDDPLETKNLAGDLELLARLRKELVQMRDELGDLETDNGKEFWSTLEFG